MPAKKKKPAKKKPPKKQPEKYKIARAEVIKLAHIGATNVEIGDFFGCDPTLFNKRFPGLLQKARAERKTRLRQMQWRLAEKGNVAMLIWIGKQELGQVETIRHQSIQADPVATLLNDVGKQVESNPDLKAKLDKELDD